MTDPKPYNPLDKRNLGKSVAEALLEQEPQSLARVEAFNGAGIYVIYYVGDFAPYERMSELNSDGELACPIYVGKAVPPGARKGLVGLDLPTGPALQKRLKEHADSIRAAKNLDISDFFCKYLIVDDIWIPLGESLLISLFSPIWNKLIDGFGNHAPGGGREMQARSRWDTLHPGRAWAKRLPHRQESPEEIAREVSTFLRNILN